MELGSEIAVPRRQSGARAHPARAARLSDRVMIGLLLAHIPLGVLFGLRDGLSRYHALAVLALGVWWATAGRKLDRAVYVACYMAGAEILWRMTGSDLFWEFGKYAVSLVLLLVLVQLPSFRTTAWSALAYFVLLLPSCVVTLQHLGPALARDALSFNLSGPLSLAVAVLLFSSLRAEHLDLKLLVYAMLAPILGVLAICSYSTLTAGEITFYAESNFITSGGFGPNQVSAILGLGALLALLIALQSARAFERWLFLGLAMVILTQGVLTFSRGGVINALICTGFLGVHMIQQPRLRITFLSLLLALTFIGSTVILPRLNQWTGGALEERYATTTATGLRQTIAEQEIVLWKEHPVLGVGPGMAKYYRMNPLGMEVAAHTEFTRMLAEHGTLGAISLLILLWIAARAYLRAPTALEKAWMSALAAWSFAEMGHAAMRIAAISLLLGLAIIPWSRRGE